MRQRLYRFAKQLFSLKAQTERNTADIKDLRQELKELTHIVRHLHVELQRDRKNADHEREKLLLKLENVLLRSERRFLSGYRDRDTTED
jgi:predicted  nucleic acid-binding Zn-ribbon protein